MPTYHTNCLCELERIFRQVRHQHVDSSVPLTGPIHETFIRGEQEWNLLHRKVHQPRLRIECHRVPVVTAIWPRHNQVGTIGIARIDCLHGAPGRGVDTACPTDRHIIFCRDQLAGFTIKHIEETVFGRLHGHFANPSTDFKVRKNDVLCRGVVPGLSGRRLVMPHVVTRLGLQCNDGRDKQVIATTRAAYLTVPGRAVADADVEEIQLGIVGHRVPNGAAAADLPPLTRPGRGSHFHRLIFKAVCWIAGHCIKAPGLFSGLRIISRHVTADAVFSAAIADHDIALDDTRGTGDRVRLVTVDRIHSPGHTAIHSIQRNQITVDCADIDLVVPGGDAPVNDIATGVPAPDSGYFRIVGPDLLTGLRIKGEYRAPGTGDIHDAVDNQRRGLNTAIARDIEKPVKAELSDVPGIDLFKGAEPLLSIGPTMGQPVRCDTARGQRPLFGLRRTR